MIYLNATEAAQFFGKDVSKWLRKPNIQSFVAAKEQQLGRKLILTGGEDVLLDKEIEIHFWVWIRPTDMYVYDDALKQNTVWHKIVVDRSSAESRIGSS